jgi:hypothetical protein
MTKEYDPMIRSRSSSMRAAPNRASGGMTLIARAVYVALQP